MDLVAVVAEGAAETISEQHDGMPAWIVGVVGFAVLMLLLFVVTRFNPNR